jgi:hypothetical protein
MRRVRKQKDFIVQKKAELASLREVSAGAIDLITNTIDRLSSINDEIDTTIVSIEAAKAELDLTEKDLMATRDKNEKIANRFKQLVEA